MGEEERRGNAALLDEVSKLKRQVEMKTRLIAAQDRERDTSEKKREEMRIENKLLYSPRLPSPRTGATSRTDDTGETAAALKAPATLAPPLQPNSSPDLPPASSGANV